MQSLDCSVHRFLIFFFSSIFRQFSLIQENNLIFVSFFLIWTWSFKIMYLYSNLNNISKILLYFHHYFIIITTAKKKINYTLVLLLYTVLPSQFILILIWKVGGGKQFDRYAPQQRNMYIQRGSALLEVRSPERYYSYFKRFIKFHNNVLTRIMYSLSATPPLPNPCSRFLVLE